MATTDFIAAIELGSSKVSAIAGHRDEGSLIVQAFATTESSSFIHKGAIYNIDKAAQAFSSLVSSLEDQLESAISKVYVGVGGQSLRTVLNIVSRTFETEEKITEEIINEISDENLKAQVSDMVILDVAPQEFKIDNNQYADPVGVSGNKLTGHFLNVVARMHLKAKIEQSFAQAHVQIADIVVTPLAMAKCVLTETEMRQGCALVDFGADTTTIAVYKNNILRFLSVLPFGGNTITHDVSSLRMEDADAEKLKLKYGDAYYEEQNLDNPQMKHATCKRMDGGTLELRVLNELIGARAEEILRNVDNQLKLSGYADKLYSGVVFTGGGSNLRNLDLAFRKISKIDRLKTLKYDQIPIRGRVSELRKDGLYAGILSVLASGDENCAVVAPELPAETENPDSDAIIIGSDPEPEAPVARPQEMPVEETRVQPQQDLFSLQQEREDARLSAMQREVERREEEQRRREAAKKKKEEEMKKKAEARAAREQKTKARSEKIKKFFERFTNTLFEDEATD